MFWRRFPKKKPKKDGWYQCTIEFGSDHFIQHYVMDLFWDGKYAGVGRWKDNRRQEIFNTCHVYAFDPTVKAPNNRRLTTNHLCDRTDSVVAWRKMSKPFTTAKYRKIVKSIKERKKMGEVL